LAIGSLSSRARKRPSKRPNDSRLYAWMNLRVYLRSFSESPAINIFFYLLPEYVQVLHRHFKVISTHRRARSDEFERWRDTKEFPLSYNAFLFSERMSQLLERHSWDIRGNYGKSLNHDSENIKQSEIPFFLVSFYLRFPSTTTVPSSPYPSKPFMAKTTHHSISSI